MESFRCSGTIGGAVMSRRHNLRGEHANWSENFPYNRVAESPKEPKETVNTEFLNLGHSARQVLGDGSFGGPYQVDDELMYALFDEIVADVTERVQSMRDSEDE